MDDDHPLRLLTRSPHRAFFLIGVLTASASVLWWTLIMALRPLGLDLAPDTAFPGWMHAVIMLYWFFPPFIFGFTLTVFPRWNQGPSVPRWTVGILAVLLSLGIVLGAVGLYLGRDVIASGFIFTALAWLGLLASLVRVVWSAESVVAHAWLVLLVLTVGFSGLVMTAAWLLSGDPRLAHLTIKAGLWGFLLPLFFTVSHRMLPFFAHCVLPDYPMVRPTWALVLFPVAALTHLGLAARHLYHWTWVPDLVLLAIALYLSIVWADRRSFRIPLLAALHIAFFWLALGTGLAALQSIWLAATGDFVLGRAPEHALGIGFFLGMLFAMVVRVSQGHSGRPLVMPLVQWSAFLTLQLVAVIRVLAELPLGAGPSRLGLIVSSLGLSAVVLLWAVRHAPMYWRPRVDGKPG